MSDNLDFFKERTQPSPGTLLKLENPFQQKNQEVKVIKPRQKLADRKKKKK